ncbi:WD40 repeat domain-containing protein [Pontibacter populi]|uniref:WD40 repeat domain-containing protein n=1 Tax=Pontibacter populi TaxID=890055 RepID=A0ABV1RP44_9BACT
MLKKWTLLWAGLLIYSSLYAQKVEHTTLGDPKAIVYDLGFSKDGSKLATTEGNRINIWALEQQQLIQTLSGHESAVLALAYVNDNMLVSGSKDGQLVLWNTVAGTPQKRVAAHQGPVTAVAVSPDGNFVATAGADHLVKVWNMASGKEETVFKGHTADVTSVAFSKSGDYLISGGGDCQVMVWQLSEKKLYKTLLGHTNWVRSIAMHPDGNTIASSGDDKRTLIWKLQGAEATTPVQEFRKLHTNWITSVDYQTNGSYFVSTGHDNNMTISRADSPENYYYKKYRNTLINHKGYQYAWKAAFQPNSYRVAVATLGGGVMLTDYFQKIYNIPHELIITAINKQQYKEQHYEFKADENVVKIEGEVSRPKMVAGMHLLHGKETIAIDVRRNGKFSVTVNLAANGSDLNFTIIDKDGQINPSGHSIKVHYQK